MRIAGLFTFFSILLASSAAFGQGEAYVKTCTAVVRNQTAEFTFPLPKRKIWTWNMTKTKENYLEYSWQICLKEPKLQCKYAFGVYHFKLSKSPGRGDLKQLLFFSQKSVCNATGRSMAVQRDLKIDANIESIYFVTSHPATALVISITDKKTFARLFANHPTLALCNVQTPYNDINFESETQIKYLK